MTPLATRISRSPALWLFAGLVLFATAAHSAPPGEGPTLGVAVQDVPFERLDKLGIPQGVIVREVLPGSPAAEAGIKPGDVVIALDGAPVYSVERLQWLVARQPAGEPVTLKLHRGGEQQGKEIDINVVPILTAVGPQTEEPLAPTETAWLGIRMQPLTDALRQHYGVPAGRGVLVADVVADSPAAKANLHAGDVLMRIDRKAIRSPFDVYRALNFFDPGDRVELEVMRSGESKTFEATLGRTEATSGMPFHHPYQYRTRPRPGYWPEPPEEFWPEHMRDFLEQWRLPSPQPPKGMQAPSAAPHTDMSL